MANLAAGRLVIRSICGRWQVLFGEDWNELRARAGDHSPRVDVCFVNLLNDLQVCQS
ncbi:MAG: hypothetical protein IGQ88_12605 [Gloeomargaritaceae cyanobacterium C42_A2020_066]|nr:hypothetical protein [Gloeomargaritaceae cyanobacterium C42_A2020_066]